MVRHKSLLPLAWMPLFGLALIFSLAGYSHAQVTTKEAPAKTADGKVTAESRSIQVGERFPNFELKDQDGKSFGLKKALSDGPVVLVVYRSADWWPFCKRQLVQLQQKQSEFTKNGLQVVGFSYDSVSKLATFAKKKKLSYPLVSDEGSKTIKALDLEYQRGLPYPGTFIIGKDGVVKGKLFKDDYKKRHSVDEILKKAIKVSAANEAASAK